MRLLRALHKHLPERPVLVEPFVGAGALFGNTLHQKVYINDLNGDLINLYRQIKEKKDKFIKSCEHYFSGIYNNKSAYYELRERFNQSLDDFERGYLFLYLNRHGYNGLCRYNSTGGYNVPFGQYRSPYFPAKEMHFFQERLQTVEISNIDYAQFMRNLMTQQNPKDLVFYCDPPYMPISKTANFTNYTGELFTDANQHQLASLSQSLWQAGAAVMISNHDLPILRKLYKPAAFKKIQVKRVINCRSDRRTAVDELLAIKS